MKIENLKEYPIQGSIDDTTQLFHLIGEITEQIGCCSVIITSFSASEEFVRKIIRLKINKKIDYAELLLDRRAVFKMQRLIPFIASTFDLVYLSTNHSKMCLLQSTDSPKRYVTIMGSQNMTRGNRIESSVIIESKQLYQSLSSKYRTILNKATTL